MGSLCRVSEVGLVLPYRVGSTYSTELLWHQTAAIRGPASLNLGEAAANQLGETWGGHPGGFDAPRERHRQATAEAGPLGFRDGGDQECV